MIGRGLAQVSLIIALASFAIGCAKPKWQQPNPRMAETTKPEIENEVSRLSVGDTIVVTAETEMPGPQTLSRRVNADGTILIWNGKPIRIAGLTQAEAADEIRAVLVTNFLGLVINKVTVQRVQLSDPVDANINDRRTWVDPGR